MSKVTDRKNLSRITLSFPRLEVAWEKKTINLFSLYLTVMNQEHERIINYIPLMDFYSNENWSGGKQKNTSAVLSWI